VVKQEWMFTVSCSIVLVAEILIFIFIWMNPPNPPTVAR
jgi:hypothetical protein